MLGKDATLRNFAHVALLTRQISSEKEKGKSKVLYSILYCMYNINASDGRLILKKGVLTVSSHPSLAKKPPQTCVILHLYLNHGVELVHFGLLKVIGEETLHNDTLRPQPLFLHTHG